MIKQRLKVLQFMLGQQHNSYNTTSVFGIIMFLGNVILAELNG